MRNRVGAGSFGALAVRFWYVYIQRAYDEITSSLLRQNDGATSFWRNNYVVIASCARWDGESIEPIRPFLFRKNTYVRNFTEKKQLRLKFTTIVVHGIMYTNTMTCILCRWKMLTNVQFEFLLIFRVRSKRRVYSLAISLTHVWKMSITHVLPSGDTLCNMHDKLIFTCVLILPKIKPVFAGGC